MVPLCLLFALPMQIARRFSLPGDAEAALAMLADSDGMEETMRLAREGDRKIVKTSVLCSK